MANGLNPAPGSLQGTLSAQSLISSLEALRQQQEAELAARTQAAAKAAGQAQQAYTQAAGAPTPGLGGLAAFLPTLLGDIGSVLTETPGPRQVAAEGLATQRASLLKARADNIKALQDVYAQRADEAQKAGDLEATQKFRTSLESLHRQQEIVLANQKRADQAWPRRCSDAVDIVERHARIGEGLIHDRPDLQQMLS